MKEKPFYFRIESKDFGAQVFKRSDEELLAWIKSFAIALMSNTPTCEYSQSVIEEAISFKEKKKKAAQARWNKSDEHAVHEQCTSDGYAYPMPETETETETELKNNILSDFDVWWDKYDKKTGRAKAFEKWKKLKPALREKCLSVVSNYVKSTPTIKFRKNPLTYLNGQHWDDEIKIDQSNQNKLMSRMDVFRANMESVEVID